ncbi:translation initiation factor IF-2 [Candidatus Micrarchaeota archaeon]|nr:translation initiation factor IF-2 [Candidatus Micrarchaeota archaeon]MBD3418262.1 translation initiation factor IF-2 [Candidatus Micrarchaeota archaeon]
MALIRSPIVCVLGHVDHGKTTFLDRVRGSAVASKEAGKITQMIGASYLPTSAINRISESVKQIMKTELVIPGLLFIDTPGHEAFTNLRERGGALADIAVLVVDITQGFQPQTLESIKILKQCKTPFIVAANKLDIIHGWKKQPTNSFIESFSKQPEHVQRLMDEKIYKMMGQLSEHGFDCERFDRMQDFTKQIAIVPISAKSGEGLAELLLLISGMSQKYLEKRLHISGEIAKGSVIEVKEEKGMGATLDVVLYDGTIERGEEIAYLTQEGVKKTKVRALLQPNLAKKTPQEKYINLDKVVAAAGVKIVAPGLEDTIPGSPFTEVSNFEKQREEMETHLNRVLVDSEEDGVVVKADSLGSVEAILHLFEKSNIPVKKAGIGPITRKDVLTAHAVSERNRYKGVLFGFCVKVFDEAREEAHSSKVPLFWSNVIYKLAENYEEWLEEEKQREKKELETELPWPAKLKVLPGFFFRLSKPAVFGVEILEGRLRKGSLIMNEEGRILGEVKNIQSEGKAIDEAKEGAKVAISSPEITLNRDVQENDSLYVAMHKKQIFTWEEKKESLSEKEQRLLEKIKQIVLF